MRSVTVSVDVSDACSGVSCKIISVSSNEEENGKGDGRVYTITGGVHRRLRKQQR